jgi:mono/diheme cytochrome c family protein
LPYLPSGRWKRSAAYAPPLTNTEFVRGDKKRLIGIVLNGMQGEIEVEGDMYNNLMASQDFLTNEQIADVLTYVRNSFGNKYSLITPAEVKNSQGLEKK